MDWSDIVPLLIGLLAVVGLPFAIRSRRKGGGAKVGELCQHLLGIGVKASPLEEGANLGKARRKRSRKRSLVGVINLTGRNIDSINVIGVASQYNVRYFLDFLVSSSSLTGREQRKKTMMVRRKSSTFWGKVVEIEWKGDEILSRKLNLDYRLKDKLLQADLDIPKGGIGIFPEPKRGYTRIRTSYFLPTPDIFEATDSIAKHIKSV